MGKFFKTAQTQEPLTKRQKRLIRTRALRGGNRFTTKHGLSGRTSMNVADLYADMTIGSFLGAAVGQRIAPRLPGMASILVPAALGVAGSATGFGIFSSGDQKRVSIHLKHFLKGRGITDEEITPAARSIYLDNFDREAVKRLSVTSDYKRISRNAVTRAKREVKKSEYPKIHKAKWIGIGVLTAASLILPHFATTFTKAYRRVVRPSYKAPSLTKFGSTLRIILQKANLPKRLIGADPEILGFKGGIGKNILTRGLKRVGLLPHKVSNVGQILSSRVIRDVSVQGIELNPSASIHPKQLVANMRKILKGHYKTMQPKESLSNLAFNAQGGAAGGHIHIDVLPKEPYQRVIRRGMAGSLLPHYIVPGSKQRAFQSSYGQKLLDSRDRMVVEGVRG